MDEIKLKISNNFSNMVYKGVLLRKFFCMMFIDTSGRKLDIFIATVFGGIKKEIQNIDDVYSSVQCDPDCPCSLQFEFSSSNNEKLIKNISFNDKTQSFWDQTTCMEKIWGKCTAYNNQKEVNDLIKEKYPSLYPNGEEAIVDVSKTIYYINQDDKKSHSCIVTQGEYQNKTDKTAYKYTLSNREKVNGLEAMNWIHTEINLTSNILNKTVLFSIELDKNKIYTPDFTWYFAPPAGFIVGKESHVKIGKAEGRVEENCIQNVLDETTVVFNEWRDPPLAIEERKKSRVLFKSVPAIDAMNLSKDEFLAVSLNIINPHIPTNRQFFIGLLIAFLLAFCSDKTRINDFYNCLHEKCVCSEGLCYCMIICNSISILAPILLLCTFLVFILTPKKTFPPRISKNQRIFKAIRIVSIGSTFLLLFYVFGLWLVFPGILQIFINCKTNLLILILGFLIAMSSDIAYLIYSLLYLKRKIYNYL